MNNIKIEEISVPMSNGLLKTLEKYNIKTLGELLDFAKSSKFVVTSTNGGIYDELVGLANLLKCKYYNEDPMIDLTDTNITQNLRKIGYSTGTYNALVRRFNIENTTIGEYLNYVLLGLNTNRAFGIGTEKKKEIISKTNIVLDYYKNKEKTNTDNTTNNGTDSLLELVSLNEELKELITKRNELDSQINILVNRIKNKTEEIGKGSK